jgi:hypothetical protein
MQLEPVRDDTIKLRAKLGSGKKSSKEKGQNKKNKQ